MECAVTCVGTRHCPHANWQCAQSLGAGVEVRRYQASWPDELGVETQLEGSSKGSCKGARGTELASVVGSDVHAGYHGSNVGIGRGECHVLLALEDDRGFLHQTQHGHGLTQLFDFEGSGEIGVRCVSVEGGLQSGHPG